MLRSTGRRQSRPGPRAHRRGVRHSLRFAAVLAIACQPACSAHPPAAPERAARTGPAASEPAASGTPAAPDAIELLGEATLPAGLTFEETPVGGLSGITYDPDRDRYYAVSDDPSSRSPARFYTLRIDLSSGALTAGGVEIEAVTPLTDRGGRPLPRLVMDAEGIALTSRGTLLVSAEGNVRAYVAPSLRELGLDGRELRELRLPQRYRPRCGRPFGVRHNNAFEALAWAASGDGFHAAVENALEQDGLAADVGRSSPVRIARYAYPSGKVVAEHVYLVEPVVEPPADPDAFRTNGLVELLDLGGGELLALERSYTEGAGYSVRLYAVSTRGATDVRKHKRLADGPAAGYTPVGKRLLLDLGELGLALDNLEGMSFGPPLPDGRRSLVLISDDNFNALQKTQVLAFAVSRQASPD